MPAEIERKGEGSFRLIWAQHGIEAEVSRLADHSNGELSGEVLLGDISHPGAPRLIVRRRMNLLAGSPTIVRDLASREAWKAIPWTKLIEELCFQTTEAWREGEPLVDASEIEPRSERWLLWPYIEMHGSTVLFGPGGSLKSMLAIAMACSLASGVQVVGDPRTQCAVAYLDWESDGPDFSERLRAIAAGHALDEPPRVYYRQMRRRLTDSVEGLGKWIAKLGIGLVVLDSMTAARAAEVKETHPTSVVFDVVRELGIPALIIDHVSKEALKNGGRGEHSMPIGTVTTENRARNTWSVVTQGEEGASTVDLAMVHQKTNSRKQLRHAWKAELTSEGDRLVSVRFKHSSFDVWTPTHGTLGQRILAVLGEKGSLTPTALGEALGESPDKLRGVLGRLREKGAVVRMEDAEDRRLARYGLSEDVERPAW